MKKSLALLSGILLIALLSFGQSKGDTVIPPKKDTDVNKTVKPKDSAKPAVQVKRVNDSAIRTVAESAKNVIPKPKDTTRRAVQAVADSSRPRIARDTNRAAAVVQDTVPKVVVKATQAQLDRISRFMDALRAHPYFNVFGKALVLPEIEKKVDDRDGLFYFVAGLLMFYALVKVFFRKYVDNIMTLFFRVTMRQQQMRDQMLQTPFASLLLNILYLLSGGMYLMFVARYYGVKITDNNWILMGYGSALLLTVYLGKFILLKLAGWIFNISAATDTYIFIVFLVNKIIGILLLPVLVMMAFPYPGLFAVVLTLSYIMLALFFGYRFIISYKPIRNEIKVTRFHFFLYLCAFEIAPLLLIYKVLLVLVERSY
ncbi:DUF4271 domain-containing protein [Pseudoflavitalea sp. G-6-1-2]|uniref:DUF4271 domain-containing protein n=1 Tax=Pseudoflavitalea sp. G-6-1-2 TaxID=2728841 RepID=UPI00146E2FF0|nr:DUF4271 domain-containing protein [Pseudoflavitalea sp. G-6-1-2]